jgi:ABC-type transporter Mla subunit MlaD
MTTRDWRAEFETAEGKAHELVGALETLQREASEYRDLNRTIEGGSEALTRAAGSFDDLLPKVEEVLTRMNALGTPELRQDVEGLGNRLDVLEKKLGGLVGNWETSTQRITNLLIGILALSVLGLIGLGVLLFGG